MRAGISRLVLAGLALVLGWSAAGSAELPPDLYQAVAVVTGTGEKNRKIGFALALETVLAKVSGDPRLLGDKRVLAQAAEASRFVREFRYRDRLEGIPIHDEQGTYDRPHFLTVDFHPEQIDRVLRDLGREPWLAPRPRLAVFLAVRRDGPAFAVSRDGARDADMREALLAAAAGMGFEVAVPNDDAIGRAGFDPAGPDPAAPGLHAVAQEIGGEAVLMGSLAWSDADLGWVADWSLAEAGRIERWQVRGVSYDDAFRNGIRGAAQVLSGHGTPG